LLLDEEGNPIEELTDEGKVILDKTPFYATGGGQVADVGYFMVPTTLRIGNGPARDTYVVVADVCDVTKAPNGQSLHHVKMKEGHSILLGEFLYVHIDDIRRSEVEKNHTATHLLHQALKKVLGENTNQAGSLVNAEYLRFDFSHRAAMEQDEIEEVEALVNEMIFEGLRVNSQYMSLDAAKEKGAMALFGEKYDAKCVRVIEVGDFSIELCGGTHVSNTAEIGLFKIISESGIGAGIRRIEAVTSKGAFDYLNTYLIRVNELATRLKAKPNNLENRVDTLVSDLSELKRENESLKAQMANVAVSDLASQVEVVNGINLLTARLDGVAMNDLKTMIDEFKQKLADVVIVLASEVEGKVSLACGVTPEYVKQGLNAGKIVKEVAMICGGNGGGRPDMATAGAKEADKIETALEKVKELLT